jgi:hypothetical protein
VRNFGPDSAGSGYDPVEDPVNAVNNILVTAMGCALVYN